jgi:hypothetical protein
MKIELSDSYHPKDRTKWLRYQDTSAHMRLVRFSGTSKAFQRELGNSFKFPSVVDGRTRLSHRRPWLGDALYGAQLAGSGACSTLLKPDLAEVAVAQQPVTRALPALVDAGASASHLRVCHVTRVDGVVGKDGHLELRVPDLVRELWPCHSFGFSAMRTWWHLRLSGFIGRSHVGSMARGAKN